MNVLDLFSGIGGFSLGLERAGMRTVAFCEIDPFCRRVLAKHWPGVPIHHDVTKLRGPEVGAVDVICGGFPCQDISVAGKGAGIEGERSGLWSEYARIISEVRPRFVIVENVSALLNRGLERILRDLAALGFDAEWHCIPASAVGAPHRRDRIWIVAYAHDERAKLSIGYDGEAGSSEWHLPGRRGEDLANAYVPRLPIGEMLARIRGETEWTNARQDAGVDRPIPNSDRQSAVWLAEPWRQRGHWLVEPDVGRVADGIPGRVDRLRSLGNAVVPQIPEIIGRAIMTALSHTSQQDKTP